MRIEIHKAEQMCVFLPTIGIDTEYRCLFFVWLNRAICLELKEEWTMTTVECTTIKTYKHDDKVWKWHLIL